VARETLSEKALEPGALWLSRPPFALFAKIEEGPDPGEPAGEFSYALLDRDGATLVAGLRGRLDAEWWYCYRPLTPRYG
jgi:hypothetical protein